MDALTASNLLISGRRHGPFDGLARHVEMRQWQRCSDNHQARGELAGQFSGLLSPPISKETCHVLPTLPTHLSRRKWIESMKDSGLKVR